MRTLRKKIDFERTTINKNPEEFAKLELYVLKEEGKMSTDLVIKDQYVLNF